MKQSIISKGKNIEEAIYLGLDILDVRKSEVDIEIIQYEKNGFIGMGKKEAIVKLSLTKQQSSSVEPKENQISFDTLESIIDSIPDPNEELQVIDQKQEDNINNIEQLEGKAWIKDSIIQVKDCSTSYVTVSIEKEVTLFKNGQQVKQSSTVVSEKDQLEVRLGADEEVMTKWKVTLDNSKLKASLNIEPGYRITRRLEDVEPSEHIELKMIKEKLVVNTIKYKEVLEQLEKLRVIYGFNYSEIVEAINATEPGMYVIATGKEAQPGKDGWIEYKVELNPMNGLIEDDAGNVDFRETKLIPTVEKGSIIGVIHPPIPGIPGITVTNEPIPAKQSYPINVITGKGIEVIGNQLVATESGRPSVEKRGQIVKVKIVPKLLHQASVDIASGNIRFHGDVEITGEVEENMLVEAEGDINIHRSVSMATLTTLKSIIIKGNVLGSELSAGKHNMLIVELGHLLGIMHQQLDQMIVVIKQLLQSPAFKSTDFNINGIQPLIMILLEKRFQSFLPYAKKYYQVVEKGESYLEEKDWIKVGIVIRQIFLTLTNQVTTLDKLIHLQKEMKELAIQSQLPVEPNAFITISDTINSKLYSSGDVNIIGKGCISSRVHAGGRLVIRGVLRGGEVYGRLGVSLNEVGAISGVRTIVAVPSDQKILIKKAYDGTVLKIGNVSHKLKTNHTNLLAKLDENGKIIFE